MQLGQSRTLPVEKPELIDLAQAARYFGARGEADTATMALLQRCAVPLLAAATPRAVWLRAEVKALAEARHPAGQRRDAASGGLRAGHSAGP